MFIDCHVHLLPRRRLAGLMKWMHGFYPEHPIPRSVTLEQCIAYYDTIPVDYIFNLVYPIRDDETEVVNRFNLELHQRYPWIIPIYRTLDRAGLGESMRERLVGGTAERFVRSFWPDFDARDAKTAVARRDRTRPTSSDPSR